MPPLRGIGLVGRTGGAVDRAHLLDLVEVLRIRAAGQCGWTGRTEHRRVGDDERLEVPGPRPVRAEARRCRPPLAGLGANDPGLGAERAVVLPCGDHRSGGLITDGDAGLLRRAVRYPREVLVVLRLQRRLLCREEPEQHPVRRGGDGGVHRLGTAGPRRDQVRLIGLTGYRVHRVVDRAVHHREAAPLDVGSLDRDVPDGLLGVQVPDDHRVGGGFPRGRGQDRRSEHERRREHNGCGDADVQSPAARSTFTLHDFP